MNLSLKTDVTATNRKLREYQVANGMQVDKELEDVTDPKAKVSKRRNDDNPDRSGLIKGLKKVAAPKPIVVYDPFEGMPVTTDYYKLSDDYDTGYNEYKKDQAILAGGYDFRETLEESLLRAFAGFGVFVEEEKAHESNQTGPTTRPAAVSATDDVF